MRATDIPRLIESLGSKDQKTADEAAARLTALGPAVATALLDALADESPFDALLEPLRKLTDGPDKLRMDPPKDARKRRIEDILVGLGPQLAPMLVERFDAPQRSLRASIARVLARHGETSIRPLLAALSTEQARFVASDALAAIGEPAVKPLAMTLSTEPVASPAWHAADAAFCRTLKAPALKEITEARANIRVIVLGSLIAGLLAFGLFYITGIGLSWSLLIGFVAGYCIMGAVLGEATQHTYDGWDGAILFIIDMLAAPFILRNRLATLKTMAAEREQLVQTYNLPA
jgi:hypothetical protein